MNQLSSPVSLIKKSWKIFTKKDNLAFLVKIYLPLGILTLLSLPFSYTPSLYNYFDTFSGTVVVSTYNFVFLLVVSFINLAGIVAIIGIVKGDRLEVKKVYQDAWSKYFKFLVLTIVIFLLYLLGLILLIFPFILAVTWLVFSKFLFVEKRIGIRDSLTESKKMVKGMFWKIFGRIAVFAGFSMLSQMVLSVFPYGIGSLVFNLSGALFVLPYYLLYKEVSFKTI